MNPALTERAEIDVTSALIRFGYAFNTTRQSPAGRIWVMAFAEPPGTQPPQIPLVLFVNGSAFGGAVVLECAAHANLDAANRALFDTLPAIRLVENKADPETCSLHCFFPLADEGPAVARSVVAFACTTLQMGVRLLYSLAGEQFRVTQRQGELSGAFVFDIEELVRGALSTGPVSSG